MKLVGKAADEVNLVAGLLSATAAFFAADILQGTTFCPLRAPGP
jgi:hypothetical protein